MNTRMIICLITTLLSTASFAEAQQAKKVPRIGFLIGSSPSANTARIDAFRQGLRELGYLEEKNIVIEYRWAEGKFDRLPELAAELVHLKVDVIILAGSPNTRARKEATKNHPIIITEEIDLVGSSSMARAA